MKAVAVLLFAAGITTAATIPVHPQSQGLAIRQDVAAEVVDEAEAEAEVEEAEVEGEEVAVEEEEEEEEVAEEENVEEEEEVAEEVAEEENVEEEENNNEEEVNGQINVSDIENLSVNDLLNLNLGETLNFNSLNVGVDVLALGVSNLFNGFAPGFLDINALQGLGVGQLVELMIVAQTLFQANAFGLVNQAQLFQILGSGFIGGLPIGLNGQIPINLNALAGLNGFNGGFFKRETSSTL